MNEAAEKADAAGASPAPEDELTLETVLGWKGAKLSEIGGGTVGKVEGAWADAADGSAAWLLARIGRLRHRTAIPVEHAAEAAGRVWVPYDREQLRTAPRADPGEPLEREQELALCTHYGIPETSGRAAAVAGREAGSATATPA